MAGLDAFFKLGEKATGGDPVRKAKFDYSLYWVIFLSFTFLSINYFYNYIFNGYGISTLVWGIILGIFSWFNYWALLTFRGVYQNMQKASDSLRNIKQTKTSKEDEESFLEKF